MDSWISFRVANVPGPPGVPVYTWDGTDNIANDDPTSSVFKDRYFFNPDGKAFTAHYDDADDPTLVTSVTYNGSQSKRDVQMAEKQTTVDYGMVGSGPKGLFIVNDGAGGADTTNIFTALIDLRDALERGEQPSTEILKPVEDMTDHVIGMVVDSTVNQKKLESMKDIVRVSAISSENRLGDIEDLDVALAISQMSALEASFQASMQMVQRINGMQLMNFL